MEWYDSKSWTSRSCDKCYERKRLSWNSGINVPSIISFHGSKVGKKTCFKIKTVTTTQVFLTSSSSLGWCIVCFEALQDFREMRWTKSYSHHCEPGRKPHLTKSSNPNMPPNPTRIQPRNIPQQMEKKRQELLLGIIVRFPQVDYRCLDNSCPEGCGVHTWMPTSQV